MKTKLLTLLIITISFIVSPKAVVNADENTTFKKLCQPRGWTECAIWSIGEPGTGNRRTLIGPFPKDKLIATGHPEAEKYELLARILDQEWTAQQAPNINRWIGVTYGNGLFVAVASSGSGASSRSE